MKITICDDNGAILSGVQQMLKKIYSDEVLVDTTRLPENLLEEWENYPNKLSDIVLMDIEYSYSEKNGIEIVREMQKKYPGIKVIFITGNINYAQDIFETWPSGFLVKPIDSSRLKKAVDKAMEQIQDEQSKNLSLKSRGGVVRIPFQTIHYIESFGHQIKVHTSGNDMIFRMKLAECMELLSEDFWLIHQSYIVNSDYVGTITKDGIELLGGTRLPIARSKYREVKDKFFDKIEKN